MILLDTCAVLPATLEPHLLSRRAAEALRTARRANTGVAISDVTLWELAMAVSRGRVACPLPLNVYLAQVEARFVVLPVTPKIAEWALTFSTAFPKDPMDRIIAATAIAHHRTLVTSDKNIRKSGEVPCIW